MQLSIIKKEALKSFSDRTIALSYIILIFTFSIPKFTSFNYDPNMDLTKLAPHLSTFAVSFITIAAFWVSQGRILNLMPEVRANVTWQYRACFICLVLVSMAAVTLSSNPFAKIPLIVYAFLLLAAAIFHVRLLYAALNIGSLQKNLPVNGLKVSLKKTALVGPACYLLAIAASFVNVYISFVCIITAMLFYIFFMRRLKSAY